MKKPRILIADTDLEYLVPLQMAFVREMRGQIDLEVVSDTEYFTSLFSVRQELDSLLVSERFLRGASIDAQSIGRYHQVECLYILRETDSPSDISAGCETKSLNMYRGSAGIVEEVLTQNLPKLIRVSHAHKTTRIALVCSAHGGAGKTTVALGMCRRLAEGGKKALYIGASRLQTFQRILREDGFISRPALRELSARPENAYEALFKNQGIRAKEDFDYVLPFFRSLQSVGLDMSVYFHMAASAKSNGAYDFVVIDAENPFEKRALDIADKIVIVLNRSEMSAYATNLLAGALSMEGNKPFYICGEFPRDGSELPPDRRRTRFTIDGRVRFLEDYDRKTCADFAKDKGIAAAAQSLLSIDG